MWRDFTRTLRELMEIPDGNGAYRPDKHYMRGPGPKWRAKYDGLIGQTARPAAPARVALGKTAEHRA